MSPTTGPANTAASTADRVLPATRILSIVIIPFLVVAFAVLYFWPSADDTARLFAWRIVPDFTSMVLASAYLGGAYFFVRAASATRWHRVGGGFLPVALFASLLGVATVVHWDKFVHTNVAFWLWAGLYFTTPFLVIAVWWMNRQESAPVTADDLLLSPATSVLIGAAGIAPILICLFLFLFPRSAIAVWPWTLTELTARVTGAIFALGAVGIGAFVERRWTSARILLQVEGVMLMLIAIAVLRSHGDFDTGKPLTWVFAASFLALAFASALLYARMEKAARDRRSTAAG
jgi:hypothetical protein